VAGGTSKELRGRREERREERGVRRGAKGRGERRGAEGSSSKGSTSDTTAVGTWVGSKAPQQTHVQWQEERWVAQHNGAGSTSSTRWVALGPLGSILFLWSAKSHKIGDWELGVAGVGMTASGQFGFAVAITDRRDAGGRWGGFRDSGFRRWRERQRQAPHAAAPSTSNYRIPKHRTASRIGHIAPIAPAANQ
jgi:hypothetical protein